MPNSTSNRFLGNNSTEVALPSQTDFLIEEFFSEANLSTALRRLNEAGYAYIALDEVSKEDNLDMIFELDRIKLFLTKLQEATK